LAPPAAAQKKPERYMKNDDIISELQRVADKLQSPYLTMRLFRQHSKFSVSTIKNRFGTWNKALMAAGIQVLPSGTPPAAKVSFSDDELLQEIVRLTSELGKTPTSREMNSIGRFSERPYSKRWGSFKKARDIAYAKYGYPAIESPTSRNSLTESSGTPSQIPHHIIVPQTHKPDTTRQRKKVQFGEPIDFRGLRFAPINEQGVVYLFGMISRELGFLIESIRTDYPDCEGKRCVDPNRQRWEHVLIEFEYKSSNFNEHGHTTEDCDLIVCWIHDWEDCPIEVLELKSQLAYLSNR
jgi:hypothetical protein